MYYFLNRNAFENLLSEWKNKNKEIHNKIARNKTELQNISMNVQALKTEKININQQINSIKIQIEQTEDNVSICGTYTYYEFLLT